jgi:hypothetical protein
MSKFLKKLDEMAAYFKDAGQVRTTLSDIKKQNLPHHYQKPLIAIADDADRDAMVDKIIAKVFGSENHNPDINTKKELQDALEKAVVEVSKESGSKFARPVQGVAANYLGRWLGTNINVEYTRSGDSELQKKGASVTAAKEVLTKTLTPTAKEKEEITQAEQPKPAQPEATQTAAEEPPASTNSPKQETQLDKEHEITEANFDELSVKIEELNKKAARKNIPQVTIERTGERMQDVKRKSDLDEYRKIKMVKFKLQVPQLTLPGGWKFIGRVDHESIGNLIVSVPGSGHEEDLHKMFGKSQPSHCDHCGKTRKRTSTFVVQDEKGKIKRIGRQCLKDYLPGGEAEILKMVNFAELLSRIALGIAEFEQRGYEGDGGEGGEGGGGGGRYDHFGVANVLGLTFCLVDKTGYLSKSKAKAAMESGGSSDSPTADIVLGAFTGDLESKVNRIGLKNLASEGGRLKLEYDAFMEWVGDQRETGEGKYKARAKKAIEWGIDYVAKQLALPNNPMKEFYQNLSVILNGVKDNEDAYVSKKYLGYLTSLVPLYNKHVQDEAANAAAKEGGEKVSEYVGTVGYPIGELNATDKRKMKKEGFESKLSQFPYNGPIDVTVTMTRTIQRDSYSYYDSGVSYMYSMTDDIGNVYVYFANNDFELQQGDTARIVKAKVKNHKDFTSKAGKTVKQTYLTRADIQKV